MVRDLLSKPPEKGRQKALLLGISYPCVESQMKKRGFDSDILINKEASVDQAIECVRRGIMTEMDGRDLARCVATEEAGNVDVYAVSKEIGCVYKDDRHIHANFNSRNFVASLRKSFGEDVQFTQVILDYYWMPTGWLVTRWARTLFNRTLPDLVRHNLLVFPSKRQQQRRKPEDLEVGVVYLPFCAHCCKEVVGAIDVLSEYYQISFVKKDELPGHSLWKGTMDIDANIMQGILGKRLDQEEIYCTFRPKDIMESMEDSHISKPAVLKVLHAIVDYEDVRMIKLRPLRQHEPPSVMKERLVEPEIGGFVGLDYTKIPPKKRGRKVFAKPGRAPKVKSEENEIEEQAPEEKPIPPKPQAVVPGLPDLEGLFLEDEPEEMEIPETTYYYPSPAVNFDVYNNPEECGYNEYAGAKIADQLQECNRIYNLPPKKRYSRISSRARDTIIELDDIGVPITEKQAKKEPATKFGYLAYNPRCPPSDECGNPPTINPLDAVKFDHVYRDIEMEGAHGLFEARNGAMGRVAGNRKGRLNTGKYR
jgi:hypothetical protein